MARFMRLLVLMLLGCAWLVWPAKSFAAEYFASPTGTSTGDGTIQKPWDLATALNKTTVVKPGDIIWLRGGTYGSGGATRIASNLKGTKDQPIIIRRYKGENVIVNGSIYTDRASAYNWFWGFEVTNTSPQRAVAPSQRPPGIDLTYPGHKVINMVVHNTGHPGIGFWNSVGDGGEIYGSILWGNGIYDTETAPGTPASPWTRGSPIYAQNREGQRLIEDVITFRNFTTGMKSYSEGSWSNWFTFRGNVTFDSGDRLLFVSAKDNPVQLTTFEENMTYRPKTDGRGNVHLGYANVDHVNAIVRNNYFVGGIDTILYFKRWLSATVTGNTVVGVRLLNTWLGPVGTSTGVTMNYNTYYGGNAAPFKLETATYDFAAWKSNSGFDANSTLTPGTPTINKIFIRPNKYEAGRANIVVYNWENKDTQDLNLTGILKNGDVYEIRDVQNYHTIIKTGTYNGSPISVPLTLTAVEPFVGTVTHIPNVHTSKEFNVFVIRVPAREYETPGSVASPIPTPSPAACIGDINGDRAVNLTDYSLFVQAFLKTPVANVKADINTDGAVNLLDYSLFVGRFLKPC